MSLSVFLPEPPDEEAVALLRAALAPAIHLALGPDLPEPATYQVLVTGRPQREHLEASPALHTLIIPWAGLPSETRELLADFPGVKVHNLHHNAVPVAELALALLLAAAKFIVPLDSALRQHDWTPRYRPSRALLLAGKTALVLGYGAVGRQVGQLCRALGMEVLGVRRSQGTDEEAVPIYPPDALHSLLPRAQVLIITLPLTSETEGLLGEAELALLPPGALLVNVGRGPVVEQGPLYHVLRTGHLRAAGLDVWYHYPEDEAGRQHTPPADFPFHELDNVVLSPHRGGATDETSRLRIEHLAHLLIRLAQGDTAYNRVDLEVGY